MDGYAIRAADVAGAEGGRPGPPDARRRGARGRRRPTPGSSAGPRSGSPPARRCRPARTPWSRWSSRRRSTPPATPGRAAATRRARCPRPAWSTSRSTPATRCGPPGRDVAAGARARRGGHAGDAGRRRARGRGGPRRVTRAPPADRRGARDRRRAARPGRRPRAPPGSRTRTAPRSARSSARPGGEPLELGIAVDRLEDVEARLRHGLATADLVVVSGGVSVGPYDVVREAFDAVGHMNLWRVAIQPGKPFAFGRADVDGRAAPVLLFGLPGNPVSSFVTFELFVRPVIRRLAGPRAAPPAGGPCRPRGAREQEPGPARLPAGDRRARRGRLAGPGRARPRPRPPRGRAGEPRDLGPRRRRRARRRPRGRSSGRRPGPRWSSAGSIGADGARLGAARIDVEQEGPWIATTSRAPNADA